MEKQSTAARVESRIREDESASWALCGSLMIVAAGCSTASLFPHYFHNSPSLASTAPVLGFNMPAIALWTVAAVLFLVRPGRSVGAGLAIAATICWMPASLVDIGSLVTYGQSVGPGVLLNFVGMAAAIACSGLALWLLVRHRVRLSMAGLTPLWVIAAGGLAIAFVIGHLLPSLALHVHLSTPGWTWPTTHTPDQTTRCCSIVQDEGWSRAREVLGGAFLIVVAVLAACCRPVRVGVAAVVGAAIAVSAYAVLELAYYIQGPPSAAALRLNSEAAPVITRYGLVGLWLLALAPVGLVLVGIGRGLSASSGDSS